MKTYPYWLEEPVITGKDHLPREGEILIVGAGLAGVSTAYWLLKEGFKSISLIDDESAQAASFRNCGHILHGTVESMEGLVKLFGAEKAKEIWSFSVEACELVKSSVFELRQDVEYEQDGYLCLAVDPVEAYQLQSSVNFLKSNGFESEYWSEHKVKSLGFKNVFGGRYEPGGAQAHPVKFRNALLQSSMNAGVLYRSGMKVKSYQSDENGKICVSTVHGELLYDAVVLATNAYSAQYSDFFRNGHLIEPFRGQIMVSSPLQKDIELISYPHSFNRGYEYALLTQDRRLMLGGWRDQVKGQEIGCFELECNPEIEQGLQDFCEKHYEINKVQWDYSWSGMMGSSKTGLPFIGPTNHPQVFTCAGFTGHGFSWAHGSARLLAQLMAGRPIAHCARYFDPCQRSLS
ncbi:MAG: NAD(P)/FAD-dependent oxidoreductase [Oligoflexales bacterium]